MAQIITQRQTMQNKYIQQFEDDQIKGKEVPDFRAGDTLRLGVEIKEGDKTRIQNFEGVVISKRGHGTESTFTVRKIAANGIGVERIFPLYCGSLKSIEVLRRGRIRRAKLNYLRERSGKKAKIKELRN